MDDTTTREMSLTVGLDLGDRYTQVGILAEDGEILEEARLATRPAAFRRRFSTTEQVRVVLEAGTHSPWVSRLMAELGHEVIVANPRKLRLIYTNDQKSDRVGAQYLARLGRLDPTLLAPLSHRSAQTEADRALLRSREALVRARTALVNHVRGVVKSSGARLPRCGTSVFAGQALAHLPEELKQVLFPHGHDHDLHARGRRRT
jgi:transposase